MAGAGLESEAVLRDKAKAYGLPEATTALLVNNGVNTLGKLAFVSAYQPGMADEAPLFTALEEVMGRGPTAAEKPILRRLYFEANTVCLADMRARIERTDASEPRKLPMAERSSRAELQKTRLEGVVMTLDNEPSHALVDRIFQQQDDGCISWIPWGQLTSRSQEAVQIKKVISFALDASGGLKARAQEDHLEARLVGDARLRQALQRRALAYDLSRMIDYKTLETWTETLFAEMMRDPPKGYRTVTVQQVQEADKRLWQLVSEQTRGCVSMQADNSKPVDAAIKLYMERTEVRLLLQPLPAASASVEPPPRPDPNHPKRPDLGGKGNPKKKQRFDQSLPEGCSAFTDANKPCCRNFNTKGCTFAKPGKRCKFGFHVCWKKGCNRPYSYSECKHA